MNLCAEYKVIVITPEDDKYGLQDGDIRCMGEYELQPFHFDLLKDYGIKTYGDISEFSKLSDGYTSEVPSFFLVQRGNIVLLNVNSKRAGLLSLLYLPDEISLPQKQATLDILKHINTCEISSNFRLENGMVVSDSVVSFQDTPHQTFLNVINNRQKNIKA